MVSENWEGAEFEWHPDLQPFLPKVYDDQKNSEIRENKQLVNRGMFYWNQNEY